MVVDENLNLALLHHTDAGVRCAQILRGRALACGRLRPDRPLGKTHNTDNGAVVFGIGRLRRLDKGQRRKEDGEPEEEAQAQGRPTRRSSHGERSVMWKGFAGRTMLYSCTKGSAVETRKEKKKTGERIDSRACEVLPDPRASAAPARKCAIGSWDGERKGFANGGRKVRWQLYCEPGLPRKDRRWPDLQKGHFAHFATRH